MDGESADDGAEGTASDPVAFHAGLTAGAGILAVDGRAYSPEELKHAITRAKDGSLIELLMKRGKRHCRHATLMGQLLSAGLRV
jgi:C-terminal processing protease CtpA/Prc